MDKIIIYGTGALARKVFRYNERYRLYQILGFVDDNPQAPHTFQDLPVISYTEALERFPPSACGMFVAVGYTRCNESRAQICSRTRSDGYRLINFISPNATCWEGTIEGENIFVGDHVFIGYGSTVHDGVILAASCTICHDNEIGAYTFFSAGVTVGGFSRIGNHCFAGLNATVRDGVTVGSCNIIGCGTNVLRSTSDNSLVVGNPGRSLVTDTKNMHI